MLDVNWIGWVSSGLGLLTMVILVAVAIWKRNVAPIYQNVIYKSLLLSSLYTAVAGALYAVGLGAAILPLMALVGMGFISVAGIYAERAKPFNGLVSPLNLSSVVVFLIAMTVIAGGVAVGVGPFYAAKEAAVMAAAAGLADSAKSAAANEVMTLLIPLFTAGIGVIVNFATRDATGTVTSTSLKEVVKDETKDEAAKS